jgi:hypothetical protein
MNEELALRVLDKVMDWDDTRAREEFAWLTLLSRFKYDTYRDFVAGVHFVERLADWLQQFRSEHRENAYKFVKERLIFLGPSEINHSVELTYPSIVQPFLRKQVAEEFGVLSHLVWAQPQTQKAYNDLLKSTLFLGLSDGARIDTLRRANAGLISNEQVLLATEISPQKWDQVLKDLRSSLSDQQARFKVVVLLDDFMGTGTTLLRREQNGTWKGRLIRFWENISTRQQSVGSSWNERVSAICQIVHGDAPGIVESHFDPDWKILVHHYLATEEAMRAVADRDTAIRAEFKQWLPPIELSCGCTLPNSIRITKESMPDFYTLMEDYYNSQIETEHTRKGGTEHIPMGYGNCALPVVLEHNTPNNSVALIWAETDDSNGQPAMRPLFRRRQRHS